MFRIISLDWPEVGCSVRRILNIWESTYSYTHNPTRICSTRKIKGFVLIRIYSCYSPTIIINGYHIHVCHFLLLLLLLLWSWVVPPSSLLLLCQWIRGELIWVEINCVVGLQNIWPSLASIKICNFPTNPIYVRGVDWAVKYHYPPLQLFLNFPLPPFGNVCVSRYKKCQILFALCLKHLGGGAHRHLLHCAQVSPPVSRTWPWETLNL